ncbi:DEAD/DEAH box helicase family protein [Streptomyces glaucescens]
MATCSACAVTPRSRVTPSSPRAHRSSGLHTDQQEAIANTVRHLRRPHSRGHVVSACGTGKTLLALRFEELGLRRLAVAVPSLDLVAQWSAAAHADFCCAPMNTVLVSAGLRRSRVVSDSWPALTRSRRSVQLPCHERRRRPATVRNCRPHSVPALA